MTTDITEDIATVRRALYTNGLGLPESEAAFDRIEARIAELERMLEIAVQEAEDRGTPLPAWVGVAYRMLDLTPR